MLIVGLPMTSLAARQFADVPKLTTRQGGQSLDDLGIVVYDVCLSQ